VFTDQGETDLEKPLIDVQPLHRGCRVAKIGYIESSAVAVAAALKVILVVPLTARVP